ncbi:dihydroxy-acid dehydratase [compost metagenome]
MSAAELAKRKKAWRKPAAKPEEKRGYRKLFMEQVTQADKGCDFEFCIPKATATAPRAKR